MSWEQSILHKTPQELDQSAQEARDRVIETYQHTLEDLEHKISVATFNLKNLHADIEDLHKSRLDEYAQKEEAIHTVKTQLDVSLQSNEDIKNKINDQRLALSIDISKETERVKSHNIAMQAREDQLNALSVELKQKKLELDNIEQHQAIVNESINKRQTELNQFKEDHDKVVEDTITKRHELNADIEKHTVAVNVHLEQVKTLDINTARNQAFYEAVTEHEAALEPLKKKYEDGLSFNEKEISRLRDQNIESYKLSKEAEKRIQVALEAEQRAKAEIEKLENLKSDIHDQIIKES